MPFEVTLAATLLKPFAGATAGLAKGDAEHQRDVTKLSAFPVRGAVEMPGWVSTGQGGGKQMPPLPSPRLTPTRVCPPPPPALPSRPRGWRRGLEGREGRNTFPAGSEPRASATRVPRGSAHPHAHPPRVSSSLLPRRDAHLKQVVSSPVGFRQG